MMGFDPGSLISLLVESAKIRIEEISEHIKKLLGKK